MEEYQRRKESEEVNEEDDDEEDIYAVQAGEEVKCASQLNTLHFIDFTILAFQQLSIKIWGLCKFHKAWN